MTGIKSNEITVSVFCITYEHVRYIAQAIESFLMQKTNFLFEIVIGEDCSKDGTREIVLEYAQKYPDLIRVITSENNVGAIENEIRTFKACKGKYIAFCEGDDFWLDPDKLQKQVDFLESNKDYAICFHPVFIYKEGQERKLSSLNQSTVEVSYTIEDIVKKNIIHTPSVVFRNVLDGNLPGWFSDSPIGDYVLHVLHAIHGKIKYLPEPMAVYRLHAGGTFSNLNQRDVLLKSIKVIDLLQSENFVIEVATLLEEQKRKLVNELLELNLKSNWNLTQFVCDLNYAMDDKILMKIWLTKRLPEEINDLRNSRSFHLGQKISNIYKFISFKK